MKQRNFQPILTDYRILIRCPICRANIYFGNDAKPPNGCQRCGRKFMVHMSIEMDVGQAREREQVPAT